MYGIITQQFLFITNDPRKLIYKHLLGNYFLFFLSPVLVIVGN